ncbi:unnamed protein product [Plutella xylostella]|uniref:(diamondback moth) hypothetical protein n=1 Tax=Plutella xylostella TaxID=51655 RepID=A0A8S4GB91_PLUXY|nr:unnamed protein product [Plutella xylostella]
MYPNVSVDKLAAPLAHSGEPLSLGHYLRSIVQMPASLRVLCLTNLFCWMAHVCYSLYFTDFVGEAVFGGDPAVTSILHSGEPLSLGHYLRSIVQMPASLRVLCLTNLFCWMAHVCYSLYFTDFVGEAVFGGDPAVAALLAAQPRRAALAGPYRLLWGRRSLEGIML